MKGYRLKKKTIDEALVEHGRHGHLLVWSTTQQHRREGVGGRVKRQVKPEVTQQT